MRKLAIIAFLFSALVTSALAQGNGVTLDLTLDQKQFLSGEDVHAKLSITNRSGQSLLLGVTTNWITFEVTDEHRALVRSLGEIPLKGMIGLQTGQSTEKEFNLTPYFDFRKPGRYSVRAIVRIPRWQLDMTSKSTTFTIATGVTIPEIGDLTFGIPLPEGVTNALPITRRYSLLRVTTPEEVKLYFQLSDDAGRPIRVYPLSRVVDFRQPEAQMDRFNNFHVIFQTGARVFTYCEIDTNGRLLARHYHEFTDSRPKLRVGDDGEIFVGGGRRLLTMNDIPAPSQTAPARQ